MIPSNPNASTNRGRATILASISGQRSIQLGIAGEVGLDPECNPHERAEDRAKCASLEGLGRVLHTAQDFYAQSNWAD